MNKKRATKQKVKKGHMKKEAKESGVRVSIKPCVQNDLAE